ncbi:F-box/kelch-repeat protein [Trifolium repens]|nr:F-box/kelch-repeat protein [Trifolium repens]
MYLRYRQNDTVSTQPLLTANNHRLLSPTDDNIFPSPFLPVELIVEILLRLPVKYLLQFRCVCKLWKTLISKIQFANKRLAFCDHTTNHYSSYPLKSLFENPSPHVIPDSFSGLEIDDYYILGSCNGFFCVYDTDQCNIIMYNPSTGLKSKRSPKISSPDWSMPYNGFGYDQVNDKYKVLAVVQHDDGDSDDEDFGVGNYVSGTLNWFNDIRYKWDKQYLVHSFDLEKETYRELLLPFVGDDYMCKPSLCVLNDRLCLCFVNKTHLVVWLMKEYGVVESWTKLMTIPREKLVFLNPFDRCSTVDLLFISNGVALLMVSSELILYNLNSGELDHLLISIFGVLDPQIYCENLISPRW